VRRAVEKSGQQPKAVPLAVVVVAAAAAAAAAVAAVVAADWDVAETGERERETDAAEVAGRAEVAACRVGRAWARKCANYIAAAAAAAVSYGMVAAVVAAAVAEVAEDSTARLAAGLQSARHLLLPVPPACATPPLIVWCARCSDS